uniref:Uncharacterized protein n=1 Tax=Rhizophora mucronata TaxID=61149 RepID=A0A2P2N6X1_RHIMU
MARSSMLISRNPDPLTVFTNLPLGGAGASSENSSTLVGIRWEKRLRLLDRR